MEKFPELFFGLVGAIGTNLEFVEHAIQDQLSAVGYVTVPIKLSALMKELSPRWYQFPNKNDNQYYERAMDGGNKLRIDMERADAVAALAMASIRRRRTKNAETLPKKRAFILNSLKRPEEVALLRDVYGASVFIVSAYSPRASRVDRLASQLAEKEHHNRTSAHRGHAETLITRDEDEAGAYGQDVRETYPLADLFVDSSRPTQCAAAIERFIALLFGDPWRTPSRDEQGMAFAQLASLRSASPARQVGAALTKADGTLISVGANEVAAPGGGQYWEADSADGRDLFYDNIDTSDRMRRNLLSDVLRRLSELKALKPDLREPEDLLIPGSESLQSLRKAQLFDTIDFIRAVHAEASALFSAAGRSTKSTLYVTTFPCHECARHIVVAGVSRVVYIEPYPKSLVSELFRDSIAVDHDGDCDSKVRFAPFAGVSPTIYQHLFLLTANSRKNKDGTLKVWNASKARPHLHVSYSERATATAEAETLGDFERELKAKGITDDSVSGTA